MLLRMGVLSPTPLTQAPQQARGQPAAGSQAGKEELYLEQIPGLSY